MSPDARVPTDGYWDPKSKIEDQKSKKTPTDQTEAHVTPVYTLVFAPAVFTTDKTNLVFLSSPKDEQDGQQ